MEIKRALEIIEEELPFTSGVIEEAMETIKNAIKKDEPQKPIPSRTEISFVSVYKCPHCGKQFSVADYCYKCGQHFDWGKNG